MPFLSPSNPLIRHFVRLRDERSYRVSSCSFLVEGRKMVAEALARGQVKVVLATEDVGLPSGVTAHLVTPALMKKISSQTHPEGVIAEVAFSPVKELHNERYLLVLDNIQDPGNVGSLIRTALALGWEAVILLPGSADPFSPKALAAAKGASLRLPLITMTAEELQAYARQKKLSLVAADMGGALQMPSGPLALILGNEGQGLSSAILALNPMKIAIPLGGDMESLNVAAAGAILLHTLRP